MLVYRCQPSTLLLYLNCCSLSYAAVGTSSAKHTTQLRADAVMQWVSQRSAAVSSVYLDFKSPCHDFDGSSIESLFSLLQHVESVSILDASVLHEGYEPLGRDGTLH
eukprot:jgi/Chrzof1/13988/Cz08g20090.t1